MYELNQVSEHDYYIDCPAKIGLIKLSETDVALIDSGSDKDAGKKVLKHIEANGWRLSCIFNTHSHADHTGGGKLLQERTGCKIYAKGIEAVYCSTPVLEPTGLYGGMPFKELRNKFLMADPSNVLPLTPEVLPAGWEILELPGHSFDMVGFRTADRNAFIADSISSPETLEKYGVTYIWDPDEALKTLEKLKTLQAEKFIPAHAPVCDDIQQIIDANIKSIENVTTCIIEACRKPCSFDELLKSVFDGFGLEMNVQQYVLVGSTVRNYLSYLKTKNMVTYAFDKNTMFWEITEDSI